jgi:uncharacterized protein YbjT (DUF2867 family)
MATSSRILVLGAGGLIGSFVAADLARRGFSTIAAARRFTLAQKANFDDIRELPFTLLDVTALGRLVEEADVVVNCLGVLQDTPSDSTQDIHIDFVERLIGALRAARGPILFVHVSIPGVAEDDQTEFSRSKRSAEQLIVESGLPYTVLRPGFVLAPRAYGGSALLRALAALPFTLPKALASRPFMSVAVEDIADTIAILAQCWQKSDPHHAATWDLMHPARVTLGEIAARLRIWLGDVWPLSIAPPMFLLTVSAKLGDLAAWLGWRPPIRSTALAELRRGVAGDPRSWMEATGCAPRSLEDALRAQPATIQEIWFARLYLLKALVIAVLVVFWCASALIVLTVAYPAAVALLTTRGYPGGPAQFMTIAGSLTDFAVGVAIAFRRTSRWGLIGGIGLSLSYMLGAAIMTPDLWVEPLGALVKTGPAIVLMLVALAIMDDR